jgi:hypothetical protein
MAFDAVWQEGVFVVENASFNRFQIQVSWRQSSPPRIEADWKRCGHYIGPQVRSHVFVVERGQFLPVRSAHSTWSKWYALVACEPIAYN